MDRRHHLQTRRVRRDQTYPAAGSLPAETVTFGYDDAGYPLTAAGLDTYIAATSYDSRGNVDQRTLGAGTKRVRLYTSWDQATGRLNSNSVATENQTTPGTFDSRLIESYSYDHAGNVTGITDSDGSGSNVSRQCFTYDRLRQLTEAWTTTAGLCQATPTQAAVGGPDPYWTSYRYNTIGNRTEDRGSHGPRRHTGDRGGLPPPAPPCAARRRDGDGRDLRHGRQDLGGDVTHFVIQ